MRYALPSDLLGSAATVTATGGTVDADYPLTNLADQRPTEVCRFTTATQVRIVWDFGSATPVDGFLLVMHNLPAGTVVTLAGNPTDAWGAPAVTATVTVLPWENGLPVNVAKDVSATAFASTGYRFVSALFPAQAADHALGTAVWVAAWQELDRPAIGTVRLSDVRRPSINATAYGVTHVVERRVRQRRLKLDFIPTDDDRTRLRELLRDAEGMALAWPIVLHNNTAGATESEPVYFVTLHPGTADEQEEAWLEPGVAEVALDLLELQRGLAL
jgi:hypothetical protein